MKNRTKSTGISRNSFSLFPERGFKSSKWVLDLVTLSFIFGLPSLHTVSFVELHCMELFFFFGMGPAGERHFSSSVLWGQQLLDFTNPSEIIALVQIMGTTSFLLQVPPFPTELATNSELVLYFQEKRREYPTHGELFNQIRTFSGACNASQGNRPFLLSDRGINH